MEIPDRNIRRRIRIRGEKFCQVCGEKALAHHFGALACQSCKAFFRRNALRQNDLKPCSKDNTCEIVKNTRRFCSYCRLKKCFDIGMKADLMFDEDQKKELMEKVKKNRSDRQHRLSSYKQQTEKVEQSPTASSTTVVSSTQPEPEYEASQNRESVERDGDSMASEERYWIDHSISLKAVQNLEQNTQNLQSAEHVKHSDKDNIVNGSQKIMQYQNGTSATCVHAGTLSVTHLPVSTDQTSMAMEQRKILTSDLKFLTRDQLPSDPQMYRQLSKDERMLLALLSAAYEDTVLANIHDRQSSVVLDSSNFSMDDFVTDCDVQVRQAVSFVKRLEDFQIMDLDDQIACFKASIGEVLTVRFCYIFLEEKNAWRLAKGEMDLELYKKIFCLIPYLELSMELCRELKSVAKNDVTVYAILHCILLFNPSSKNVSNRQLVSSMRDKYVVLLRHYLQATFSFLFAEDYMRELQHKVVEIPALNKVHQDIAKNTHCKMSDALSDLLAELNCSDN